MDTTPTTPTPAAAAPPPAPAPEPQHHHTPAHQPVTAQDYPSSPFVTAKMGIIELFKNGKRGLPAVVIVSFLLFLGMVVTLVIALLALFAGMLTAVLQNSGASPELQMIVSQLPPDVMQALSTATYAPFLGVIGLVAFAASMILSAYWQAFMIAAVTETTVQNKTLVFGEALKLAGKKLWPIVGQALLVMLVVCAVLFAFFMLIGIVAGGMGAAGGDASSAMGAVGFGLLALLALMIAGFYFACRLGLAQFAILADNKGPVESLKYSWAITKGHFWELAGVLAISFGISSVVGIVFDIISSKLTQVSPGLSLVAGLVFFAAYMVMALVCTAVLAQRYEQLRSAPTGHKSKVGLNVGAVALVIVIYFAAAFVQAQLNPIASPIDTPTYDTTMPGYEDYDTTLPDQTTDQSMEEYYQQLREQYPELYDEYYSDPEVQVQ